MAWAAKMRGRMRDTRAGMGLASSSCESARSLRRASIISHSALRPGVDSSSHVRPVLTVVLMLPLLLLGASCAGRAEQAQDASAKGARLSHVVAEVNGRVVPASIYEMYVRNARAELGLDETTEEGRLKLVALKEGVVSELIDRALISQEAVARGLAPEPSRIAAEEERAVVQLGGEEKFNAYLREHNLTREEFMQTVHGPLFGELLRRELGANLSVTDAEVKAYYDSHRGDENFKLPERVAASHILIAARRPLIAEQLRREGKFSGDGLASAVEEEMRLRRTRAEEVRRQAARRGADFEALARARSDDAATRERGGALGWFPRGAHSRAFDDAAFSLKPGQVGPVVSTEFGYHIVKLTGREPARTLTLEEAAPEIRRRLLAAREADALKRWLQHARGKADVVISEPFRFGSLRDEFPPN